MTEYGVIIKRHPTVGSVQLAVSGEYQRVDLDQLGVVLAKQVVQIDNDGRTVLEQFSRDTYLLGDSERVETVEVLLYTERLLVYLVRSFSRGFFDIDAALT